MRKEGRLTVVGAGSDAAGRTMSVEAWHVLRAAVAAAKRDPAIRFYGGDVGLLRRIPVLRGAIIRDVYPFYETPLRRMRFYEGIADMLVARAFDAGLDVYHLTAGNPLVLDNVVQFVRRKAADRGHAVRVVASMSFLDSVFAPVGGIDGRGATVLLARSVVEGLRAVDPHGPTLLCQLADWTGHGRAVLDAPREQQRFLRALTRILRRTHGARQRVHLLSASLDPSDFGAIRSQAIDLQDLAEHRIHPWTNLYVPPRGDSGDHWGRAAKRGARPR